MNKTEILVTGDSEGMVVNQINKNDEWMATAAITDEDAIEKFHQRNFDVAIFTDVITVETEKKLRKIFTIQNPDIIIARYDSSDINLLIAEIEAALNKLRKDKRPSFSFTDDALKNAGLNIMVQ